MRMLRDIFRQLGSSALKQELVDLKDALEQRGLKLGARKVYAETFERLRTVATRAQTQAGEIQSMLGATFKELNAEFGFSLQAPAQLELAEFGADLQRIRSTGATGYWGVSPLRNVDIRGWNPYTSYPEPFYSEGNGNAYSSPVSHIHQYGGFARARLSLTDSLTAIAGARLSWWSYLEPGNAQSGHSVRRELTPYAGLVHALSDTLDAYASYSEIFSPQDKKAADGSILAPARGEDLEAEGQTCVLVTVDGFLAGAIGVRDELRPEVPEVVRTLRDQGVEVSMLTGDNSRTAAALAKLAGIGDVHAELRPEDKARIVAGFSETSPTAMIGDGINDAPALAGATVGIAMGATGSDAAIESADVAFTGRDLGLIPQALRHARRGRVIMNQNIVLSLAIIAVLPPLAITGVLGLAAVVLVHEVAEVVVIANGLRAARAHKR